MRLKRYPTETTSKWQWGFKLFLSDSELSAPDHTVFHMCLALGSIPRWGKGTKDFSPALLGLLSIHGFLEVVRGCYFI